MSLYEAFPEMRVYAFGSAKLIYFNEFTDLGEDGISRLTTSDGEFMFTFVAPPPS